MSKIRTWGVEVANAVLTAILTWNLTRIIHQFNSFQRIKAGDILSNNPDFAAKALGSGVPMWAWLVNIGGLVITLAFFILWFFPRFRNNLVIKRLNIVWLILWLVYLLVLIATLVIVIQRLLRFT